ncbi:unannotated protein [freshwater metagenome]|uniref:Unannotated protein n=1 Tax=freshwater metagenome TaxID=449393 RepID=A0A6J7IRK6_9ZZZZ
MPVSQSSRSRQLRDQDRAGDVGFEAELTFVFDHDMQSTLNVRVVGRDKLPNNKSIRPRHSGVALQAVGSAAMRRVMYGENQPM